MSEQNSAGQAWLRSSYSGGSGNNNCVEVALASGALCVRDSKAPAGGVLIFPASAWRAFVADMP